MKLKEKLVNGLLKSVNGVIFTTNIISVLFLYLSISAWIIPPYNTVIPAFLGLGFFIIFIVCFLYLLLWIIFLKWKFILFNVVALAFCWVPFSIYIPINFKTDVPDNCIKLLTYNVRGFNWEVNEKARANPVFDYLKNSGADIICLQEFVINNNKYNPKGIISIAELDKILDEYPHRSVVRFGEAKGIYSFGVACYSKFPIMATRQIPVESEMNGVALYELRIKDKKINLINAHLESNRLTAEDKQLYKEFFMSKDKKVLNEVARNIRDRLGSSFLTRAHQAEKVAQYVEGLDGDGTIVCGDFNDTPISYTYNTVRGQLLADAFADTGMGQGITYNENMFWFRIDYILHTRNIVAYNCTVDKVKYSDHYPLYSYLKIN